jgi:hypothetical protein
MREDYMGALDRYRQYLPGQLRSTFRLDLLGTDAALRAVVEPARESGVHFDEEAARILVRDLGLVHSGDADARKDTPTQPYPYLEPVLLQVVCYSLFEKVSKADGFAAITVEDVENFRPFSKSIAKYYRGVIRSVAGGDRNLQRNLRDWVEHHLISKQHLRRQTRQKPPVPDPDSALRAMQIQYLIRDDPRPGGQPLWELTHDMLVGPVLTDNRAWRTKHLERWQCRAEDWRAFDQDPQYLLQGADYLAAPPERRRGELTENEQAFLKASGDAFVAEGRLAHLRDRISRFRLVLAASLLANLVLLVLLLWPF